MEYGTRGARSQNSPAPCSQGRTAEALPCKRLRRQTGRKRCSSFRGLEHIPSMSQGNGSPKLCWRCPVPAAA